MTLVAPFPWFGGKRKVARQVWQRFGRVSNFVEPFFGSGAVLLGRPTPFDGAETINDLDGMVANFWRSIKLSPVETAQWADNPVNENDLHARHAWLVQQLESLRAKLEGDQEYHDPKIAGWWVWGICCWIGSGFCSGNGPWVVNEDRQLVHLGNAGRGVNRQLVHLGDAGRGVNRKLVHLGAGRDSQPQASSLPEWFRFLSDRLLSVRVCSGDWSRVCGPSVTFKHGTTAVFLDPPYADTANRQYGLYREDSSQIAHAVREWAVEQGERTDMRIALCGYEGEHEMPSSWSVESWSAGAGYGGQATKRSVNWMRERIWYSPACLSAVQPTLFDRVRESGVVR